MKSICVYCGSSDLVGDKYLEAARGMGQAIARRKLQLVFGGGRTGLMGVVADAVLGLGGEVVGVIPEQFNNAALAHNGLTRLELVGDMHQRKARMIELADAFIALPGGFGTMEETFEALTWAQIGLHHKPIGLLNVDGYFDDLLKFLGRAKQDGFIFHEHQGLYRQARQPNALLDALEAYRVPQGLERWLER
jgi:uncharacterized protein (TIGR00730 family)